MVVLGGFMISPTSLSNSLWNRLQSALKPLLSMSASSGKSLSSCRQSSPRSRARPPLRSRTVRTATAAKQGKMTRKSSDYRNISNAWKMPFRRQTMRNPTVRWTSTLGWGQVKVNPNSYKRRSVSCRALSITCSRWLRLSASRSRICNQSLGRPKTRFRNSNMSSNLSYQAEIVTSRDLGQFRNSKRSLGL